VTILLGFHRDIPLAMEAEKENDIHRYISFCIATADLVKTAPTKPRDGFE
jgi:hypothetical protein